MIRSLFKPVFHSVAAVSVIFGLVVAAQSTTGTILGKITDQSDAVLAGATVTVKSKATGTVKSVSTNAQGEYEIPQLMPDSYELTVEAAGFTKAVRESAVVNVGSRLPVNIALQAGNVEEVVSVRGAEGAVIETTNTVIQSVVDNRQVRDLPLAGRTFANLAVLVPGAKPVEAFNATKARTGTISISGSSGRDANVSIDGGDNKDNTVGGAVQNYTTEGIQEFVVSTQNFLPDTGRSAGGQISVVTKSGSNDLHGSFVFFERNDRFNARAFNNKEFDPVTGDGPNVKQPFDRQTIAGSLGGSIVKDKLFFFGAAEYTRENVSIVIDPNTVNELRALDVFAKRGVIPGVSSVAALSTIPTPFRDTQFQIRGDYVHSPKSQFMFRYGNQENNLGNDLVTSVSDITDSATTTNTLRSALLQHTFTFNSNTVNVFAYQFSKYINRIVPNSNVIDLSFPSVNFGRNPSAPQSSLQNKHQFRDVVSHVLGRHSLKFGFDYIYTPVLGGALEFASVPNLIFTDNPSTILSRGLSLNSADDDGNPLFVSVLFFADGNSRVDTKVNQVSWFAQDGFRINSKLTLNYGVRYDADLGVYDPKGGSQATNRAVVALQKIGVFPQGNAALPKNDLNNFSPRIGVAYDPTGNGKAVLRASYGVFHDQIFQNVQFFALQQAGKNIYATSVLAPPRLGIDPLPVRTGSLPNLRSGDQGQAIDPNAETPYTQQSSVSFQYEFKPGYVVETSYSHILGLHQFTSVELNPRTGPLDPNFAVGVKVYPRVLAGNFAAAGLPALSRVRLASSINRSRYDALTVGLTRRYADGGKLKYQYGAHYTLSRALAYGSPPLGAEINSLGFGFENPFELFRPQDLAPTSQDARHRFVFNGILDLPYGFQVSTIVQAESGRPFAVFEDGEDLNGDGVFADRPRVDANGDFIRFNPGDRVTGTPLPLNAGRGKPYFQTDLRVTKTFRVGDRLVIHGYVELFNLFNRANVGNAFIGSIQSTIATGRDSSRLVQNVRDFQPNALFGSAYGPGTTLGVPFQMQLGFRIGF